MWEAICWPENGEFASTTYFVTDVPEVRLHTYRFDREHDAFALFSDGLESVALEQAMIDGRLAGATTLVAFPAEVVTDASGNFLGFTMRLVAGYRALHELYSPKSRKMQFPKADYRFLVRVAQNVARAVATVHQAGCIIGDLNHSGVLVGPDATVALIDADSFQFSLKGHAYPCVVGTEDFTPPELHGGSLLPPALL